jgi:hypothetical protein
MTNENTIRCLLDFVRYREGVLEISHVEGDWINLSDWLAFSLKFSINRLDEVDNSQQVCGLRDFFYHTFYVSSRTDLSEAKFERIDNSSDISDSFEFFSKHRPVFKDEFFPRITLQNGNSISEREGTVAIFEPGDYVNISNQLGEVVKRYNKITLTDKLVPFDDRVDWFWSNSVQDDYEFEKQHIRFYLNPNRKSTVELALLLVQYLDYYNLPFKLKRLDENFLAERCDKIVLFVSQRHVTITSWILLHVHSVYEKQLKNRIPLFVRQLLSGIGFSEEPFVDESFGKTRCQWIASAILESEIGLPYSYSGPVDKDLIVTKILEQQEILDLETMHLNPRSVYPYNFNVFELTSTFRPGKMHLPFYLEKSVQLANFICREAAWINKNGLTWFSAGLSSKHRPEYSPLNCNWQNGIIGPLLFLKSVSNYVQDPLYNYIIKCSGIDIADISNNQHEHLKSRILKVFYYSAPLKHILRFVQTPQIFTQGEVECDKSEKKYAIKKEEFLIDKDHEECRCLYEYLVSVMILNSNNRLFRPLKFFKVLRKISKESSSFLINEFGWDDFVPGMNGLSLLGFSYLLAYDPLLPPLPLENLEKESL